MLATLIGFLFGCRHKSMTRPITPAHKPGTRPEGTYVACLDCGKQFHYDLENLRIGAPVVANAAPRGGRAFQVQY